MMPVTTRVKICGLTRADDVRAAVRLGAWACGFVLTESPRQVDPGLAAQLAGETAGAAVLTVGVFATEAVEEIAAATCVAGVDAVQLSAGRDGPTVAAVRASLSAGLPPVVRVPSELSGRPPRHLIIAAADTPDASDADLVLFDSRTPGAYGGTGQTLDWAAVAAAVGASAAALADRVVLAGGLTRQNVVAAYRTVRPYAVDVSGGVESHPGVKDHSLLTAFFAAVRNTASARTVPATPGAPALQTPPDTHVASAARAGRAGPTGRPMLHPDDREPRHDR